MTRKRCVVALSLLAFSFGSEMVFADDSVARQNFEQAQALYHQREDLRKNDQAISLLDQVISSAQDPLLQYDALILSSKAYYWRGIHIDSKENKMRAFEQGYSKADEANFVADDLPEAFAEGFYYYGINLARWAEAKGILDSLERKDELFASLNEAKTHKTREGAAGETIDSYGPDRTFGRAYFKLPDWAGGSLARSLQHLATATQKGSTNALNHVYYGEALNKGNAAQKAEGCRVLKNLINQNPNTMNPDRIPETKEEIDLAKTLIQQLGC